MSAAEMTGLITKIEGNKIHFKEGKKGEDKKFEFGDEKTYTVAKDVKVTKASFKKDTEPTALEGGLKNELFTKMSEKGVFARITTNDDTKEVTAISVFAFGGKGKKKKDNGD
jgi:hypothetical protein